MENGSKRSNLWPIIAGLEAFLLLAFLAWQGISWWQSRDSKKKTFQYPTMNVEAAPVVLGEFESFLNAVGTLKATESIIVKAPDGGVVSQILFKSGDTVKKGDVLIRFDDSILQAELAHHQATEELKQKELDRATTLFEKHVFPQSKKDEAVAAHKTATAQVGITRAKLKHMELKAPFGGVVGLKDVSVGAYVKPGEEIVTLDSLDPIYVDFRVNEKDIDTIAIGKQVDVEVDGVPHNQYTGVIEAVDPLADTERHSIRVRALIKNTSLELKPGLFARVKMVERLATDIMLVPESALETEGNQEFVYAIVDGIAHKAPVKTGRRNGTVVEVTSGLQPSLMVVTAGQSRLGEGFPVVVVSDKGKLGY